MLFQSTLPAWGETASTGKKAEDRKISIHSPRMGRDAVVRGQHSTCTLFQSTLPAWGETPRPCQRCVLGAISIHSPRMGRDFHGGFDRVRRIGHFNPLSPHGERPPPTTNHQPLERFQSTLPAWGETVSSTNQPTNQTFQSTLPAWGETLCTLYKLACFCISIHSPRMGRDSTVPGSVPVSLDFNPLSPHGERPTPATSRTPIAGFQSTLPAWGETSHSLASM